MAQVNSLFMHTTVQQIMTNTMRNKTSNNTTIVNVAGMGGDAVIVGAGEAI